MKQQMSPADLNANITATYNTTSGTHVITILHVDTIFNCQEESLSLWTEGQRRKEIYTERLKKRLRTLVQK